MPKQTQTTFYIVRHGQTDWNIEKKLQGHTDVPLNETGEIQAKELSSKLETIKFDLAFSSDLLRAKRTAQVIALEQKLAVQTTEVLRERMFGKFEGQPYSARDSYYVFLGELTHEQRIHHKIEPDIESDNELVTRLITFLRETAVVSPGKTILVVTHGGPIHVLLRHFGVFSYQDKIKVGNTAYIRLLSDGVDFFVKELNGINQVK